MEEKKVCPECENTEHKLETLTGEEADKTAGGILLELVQRWCCPRCGSLVTWFSDPCPICKIDYYGKQH